MLIGSVIIPRSKPTRTIELFGKDYVFKNLAGDGKWICEVTDPRAIEIFEAHEAFYRYDGQPVLSRAPVAEPKPVDLNKLTNEEVAEVEMNAELAARKAASEAVSSYVPPVADYSAEVASEATDLLDNDAKRIGRAIGKVSSMLVVRCALTIEQARKEPRQFHIELLERTIESAKAAGIQG
jgi:hypothetical protein